MASEVDLCNLALAHLGDTATVSNLNPPEGSAQAAHCARFYPIARDSLLEMHAWGFATVCAPLALLGTDAVDWNYTYAKPSDALSIVAVLPPRNLNNQQNRASSGLFGGASNAQPFSCRRDSQGHPAIFTNQPDAVAKYITFVADTTQFSPLFRDTLGWLLASSLAGPLLKGEAGAAEAKRCLAMMQSFLSKAVESDAVQQQTTPQHDGGWLSKR